MLSRIWIWIKTLWSIQEMRPLMVVGLVLLFIMALIVVGSLRPSTPHQGEELRRMLESGKGKLEKLMQEIREKEEGDWLRQQFEK